MSRQRKFGYPHHIDHENKTVWIYVASGWPTCMAVPHWMRRYFSHLEGYTGSLCSEKFLNDLKQ